jgi:hypothetical protein
MYDKTSTVETFAAWLLVKLATQPDDGVDWKDLHYMSDEERSAYYKELDTECKARLRAMLEDNPQVDVIDVLDFLLQREFTLAIRDKVEPLLDFMAGVGDEDMPRGFNEREDPPRAASDEYCADPDCSCRKADEAAAG